MNKLIRGLTPGKTDGVVAVLGTTFVLAAILLVPSIDTTELYPGPQSIAYAVAAGLTVAAFAATDLWLLFGNPSLTRRWFSVLLVSGIPCLGLALGFCYRDYRVTHAVTFGRAPVPSLLEVVFALIVFRLAVTCCLGVASIYARTLTRWRIGYAEDQLTQRSMFQTSIGDLMLLITNIAVTIGSLCIIWSMAHSSGARTVRVIGLAGAIEAACLLMFF